MRLIGFSAVLAVFLCGAGASHSQMVWQVRNPVTQANNLNAIAWTGDNGLLVAVGVNGTIVTSTDGVNWTTRAAGLTTQSLLGVAVAGTPGPVGDRKIVVVGNGGTILWSTGNTIGTWNKASPSSLANLNGIVWAGSQFVAVGDGGEIQTSPDGSAWTHQTPAEGKTFRAVAYNGTRLVAVGDGGNIQTSLDGQGWSTQTSGTTADLYAVAASGAYFFAVGSGGVMRASSDNGLTWSARTSGAGTSYLAGITTTGSRPFVAVGNSGMITTATGVSADWSPSTPAPVSQALFAVTWATSLNRYVAVGVGGAIVTSSDGLSWMQTSSHHATLNGLATDSNTFVAVGASGTVLTSTDGGSWIKRASGTTGALYAAAYTGTRWLAVGTTGGAVLTSTDAVTWTPQPAGTITSSLYAAAGSGETMVVGGAGALGVTTNGGANWTSVNNPSGTNIYGAAWFGGSNFVVVGSQNSGAASLIRTSSITAANASWSNRSNGLTPNELYAVAYAPDLPTPMLVAVGKNGVIATASVTTPTATNWSLAASPTTGTLYSVTWTGNMFVATGGNGLVVTSPDGVTWTTQTPVTTSALNAVKWAGAPRNMVMAVGAGGRVITSDPAAVPLTPSVLAPAASATGIPVSPRFSWTASSGATSYRVQVSGGAGFADILVDTTVAGTSVLAGPFTAGSTYYWRVLAGGPTGSSAFSPATMFTLVGPGSAAPSLDSPADKAVNVAVPADVAWNAYAGATSYQLHVSRDSTFAVVNVSNDSLPGNQLSRTLSVLQYDSTYYWRVQARLASGITAWSASRRFTTTSPPPPAPALTAPADEAIAVPLNNAVFSWSTSSGAAAYHFQLAANPAFTGALLRDTVFAGTSLTVQGLATNGVYYWRVRAQNAAGASPFSPVRSFTTATAPPAAPTLSFPGNNAASVSVFTDLSWNMAAGATTHHVQLSTTSNFSAIVFEDSTVTGPSRSPGQLADLTQYWWRVRAKNPAGAGNWSATRTFSTDVAPTQPPAAPLLLTPPQFTMVGTFSPTLTWSSSATATSYRLQLSGSADFAKLLHDTTVTGTSAAVGGLVGSTDYFWRVSAINQVGAGGWSETFLFTTHAVAPEAPTPLFPEQFATGISVTPTLAWSASQGATSYLVQVSTNASFTTLVAEDTLAATSHVLSGLSGNTEYYWRVRARNSAGTSPYSAIFRFATGSLPLPAAPVLVSPAQFATEIPRNGAVLVWLAAANAASYHVQVSTSPSFPNTVVNDSGITALSLALSGLAPTTEYYWRVRGKNTSGAGDFSSVQRFTTEQGVSILPGSFSLRSAAAAGGGMLRFGLPHAEKVVVRVFDTRGHLVARLADETMPPGYHVIALPASLRGGIYLIDFRAGEYRSLIKTQP